LFSGGENGDGFQEIMSGKGSGWKGFGRLGGGYIFPRGTTIPFVAKILYLFKPIKFKTRYPLEVELSENFKSELVELEVKENSPAIGKQVFQLNFPHSSLIVLINRNGRYITPRGTTPIEGGDKLLIMSDRKDDVNYIQQKILNNEGKPS
jgi:cell volume regulation protein A